MEPRRATLTQTRDSRISNGRPAAQTKSLEDLAKESAAAFEEKLEIVGKIEDTLAEMDSFATLPGASDAERGVLLDLCDKELSELIDRLETLDPKGSSGALSTGAMKFETQQDVDMARAWSEINAGVRIGGGGLPVDPPAQRAQNAPLGQTSTTDDDSERVLLAPEHNPAENNDVTVRDAASWDRKLAHRLRTLRRSQLIDPPRQRGTIAP